MQIKENFARRVNKRCPATMLAIKRTDKVTGRMIILTVSINTIKDIKARGVPDGVRCEKKLLILLFKAKTTLISHIKNVKVMFNDI